MGRGPRRLALCAALAGLSVLGASCSQDDASAPEGKGRPAGGRAAKGKGGVEFADNFQRIRFEAASAVKIESDDANADVGGKLMRIVDDAGASGGKCVFVPDKAGTPEPPAGETPKRAVALYKFQVKVAGNYTFWCHRKWYDRCGDTFAMRIDKVGAPHAEAFLFGSDDSSKPPRWGWSPVFQRENGQPRQFFLTAGEHTLEILNREDGPRFDVILFTDDPDYVPQGTEE